VKVESMLNGGFKTPHYCTHYVIHISPFKVSRVMSTSELRTSKANDFQSLRITLPCLCVVYEAYYSNTSICNLSIDVKSWEVQKRD